MAVMERKQEQRLNKQKRKKKQMDRQKTALPSDLHEADELLEKFGRWAQDRYKKQRCASAEGLYRSPDFWNDGDLPMPLMAEFRAMDVQRALLLVPQRYRRVLHAHYIPQRLPTDAQRKRMGVALNVWHDEHLAGLRMFWNNWRFHIVKTL